MPSELGRASIRGRSGVCSCCTQGTSDHKDSGLEEGVRTIELLVETQGRVLYPELGSRRGPSPSRSLGQSHLGPGALRVSFRDPQTDTYLPAGLADPTRANAVSHSWYANHLTEGWLSVAVQIMAGTLIAYARCRLTS